MFGWRLRISSGVAVAALLAVAPAYAQSLSDTVRTAVQTSPRVESMIHNRESVDAEMRRAKGLYLPQLDVRGAIGPEYTENVLTQGTNGQHIARLKAEIADKTPQFPDEVTKEAPSVAHSEQALYDSQLDQFKSNIAVLNDQLAQKQQEIAGLQSKQQTLSRSLELAKQEHDMTAPLIASGAASKLELVKLERELTDIQGQLDDVKISIPHAEAARNEAQKRIQEKTATFHSDAGAELNKHTAELAALSQQIFAQHDRVTRTEVRSPVRGTIKDVKVTTIGEVIKPGQDIVEIVPLEDTLLVEAKVRPADVAFLHPGQPATVKITAYDFSIYGGLKARVEDISADTIKDDTPNGGTFFRVTLRTDRNSLGTGDKALPIIPGMTASAEILTGQKPCWITS